MESRISTKALTDFLSHEQKRLKFCFIMGSGCSVENGIPTGWELASKWYGELKTIYTAKEMVEWKSKEGINEDDLGFHYAQIFKFRFAGAPAAGYDAINHEIEKGTIGIGHIILAQLMLKTGFNIVITTNFDTLVEETLYTFTHTRPVICGHESLAKYARPTADHPLIVKIHRDRFMEPFNLDEEIAVLQPEWTNVLNFVFQNYIPVVIGYGGNDGSLMGYLGRAIPCKTMFWCVTSDKPVRKDILDVINHHNGKVVKIEGFSRLMLRMMPVFGIRNIDQVVVAKAKLLSANYVNSLLKLATRIQEDGTKEEKESLAQVNEQLTAQDWWYWEVKVKQAVTDEERLKIYKEALRHLPTSPDLNYNYGWTLMDFLPDKAMVYFRKAIKYNPTLKVAWYSIGLLYQRKKKHKKAISYFKKATEISSSFSEAWNQLAFCYHDLGDYTKAIDAYKALLINEPAKASAWNNLGFSYKSLGETTQAIPCFRKAAKYNAGMAEPLLNIGNIYYDRGDNKKAITYYKRAIGIKPGFDSAFHNMGLAYENLNNKIEAKKAFHQATA